MGFFIASKIASFYFGVYALLNRLLRIHIRHNMSTVSHYLIGTAGQPWQSLEKAQWLSMQNIKRSFFTDVADKAKMIAQKKNINELFELVQYGDLHYNNVINGAKDYPLLAFKSKSWSSDKPTLLVTGGVHGYETSGVHGALEFVDKKAAQYQSHVNIIVAFCVSPWGYETINRWNPQAIDPNRSFYNDSPAPESANLMAFVASHKIDIHIDLHETTDTDNSEFRPALAARDATRHDNWNIPDGFYLVGDTTNPQPEFQRAVIAEVEKVTHIAPADNNGCLIGVKQTQFGVINYATTELGLCAGFSDRQYCTTTEVYPDSPLVDDINCIDAQVAAIVGALNYIIKTRDASIA